MKTSKKNPYRTYPHMRVTDILKFYEVLFCTYCEGLLCLYIPLYMNKTHPTSGDEKGQ